MKVLVVEDDMHIREGLTDILQSEGYECIQANNGESGIEQYKLNQPQLVLLDIMMPDKDGYSVCREIRQQNTSTAIIFISAKSEEIDRVLGLELGADDYIMKPFGKHEVIARIRAVTRRYLVSKNNDAQNNSSQSNDKQSQQGSTDPDSFQLGKLTVHTQQLRAEQDGNTIELSLRDCKILQLLHAKKDQVVTRDELFNHCWGRNYLPNSRTLDQHISKLRKSIESNPKQPDIIKTVHGVGYRYDSIK